jgi:hypothetical protein
MVTVPEKVPCAKTLATMLACPPGDNAADVGFAETVKSAGGGGLSAACEVLNPAQPDKQSSEDNTSKSAGNLGECIDRPPPSLGDEFFKKL